MTTGTHSLRFTDGHHAAQSWVNPGNGEIVCRWRPEAPQHLVNGLGAGEYDCSGCQRIAAFVAAPAPAPAPRHVAPVEECADCPPATLSASWPGPAMLTEIDRTIEAAINDAWEGLASKLGGGIVAQSVADRMSHYRRPIVDEIAEWFEGVFDLKAAPTPAPVGGDDYNPRWAARMEADDPGNAPRHAAPVEGCVDCSPATLSATPRQNADANPLAYLPADVVMAHSGDPSFVGDDRATCEGCLSPLPAADLADQEAADLAAKVTAAARFGAAWSRFVGAALVLNDAWETDHWNADDQLGPFIAESGLPLFPMSLNEWASELAGFDPATPLDDPHPLPPFVTPAPCDAYDADPDNKGYCICGYAATAHPLPCGVTRCTCDGYAVSGYLGGHLRPAGPLCECGHDVTTHH